MKRRAIIAALAAWAGGLPRLYGQNGRGGRVLINFAPVEWDIPETVNDLSKPLSPPAPCADGVVCVTKMQEYEQVPIGDVLIVRFGSREVRLTAEEIMDALEGQG